MWKKVKDWFVENKEELLFGWASCMTLLVMLLGVLIIIGVSVTNDLVARIEMEVTEKEELKDDIETLKYQKAYYYNLYDSIIQDYEDVIPKQQYIDDIEYLESVILELRYQCEKELNDNN